VNTRSSVTWVQVSDSPSNREGGGEARVQRARVGEDASRARADLAAGQGEGILYRMLAAVFVRRTASRIVPVAIGVASIAGLGTAQRAYPPNGAGLTGRHAISGHSSMSVERTCASTNGDRRSISLRLNAHRPHRMRCQHLTEFACSLAGRDIRARSAGISYTIYCRQPNGKLA
jgi:hypothetical protein